MDLEEVRSQGRQVRRQVCHRHGPVQEFDQVGRHRGRLGRALLDPKGVLVGRVQGAEELLHLAGRRQHAGRDHEAARRSGGQNQNVAELNSLKQIIELFFMVKSLFYIVF